MSIEVVEVEAKVVDVSDSRALVVDSRQERIDVVFTPHPLSTVGQRRISVAAGTSLAEILKLFAVPQKAKTLCRIGGVDVAEQNYARTFAKPGQLVEIRLKARYEAIVYIAGYIIANWGWSAFAAYVFAAILVIGVSYAISRMLTPKRPGARQTASVETNTVYRIANARNGARVFDMVPVLFGSTRVTPDYFGLPYTTLRGPDQFFHAVFCYGINVDLVLDPRIGSTPVVSYDGSELTGYGHTDALNYLPLWQNVDTLLGADLLVTNGSAVPLVRTINANTLYAAVEIEASVYGFNGDGSLGGNQELGFLILISEDGGAFTNFFDAQNAEQVQDLQPDPVDPRAYRFKWVSTSPLRAAYYRRLDPNKSYQIAVAKTTLDIETSTQVNKARVSQFLCYQPAPSPQPGLALGALTLKASGQLTGSVDQFSVFARSKPVPLWDGNNWLNGYTSNCGALALQLARGVYAGAKLVAGYGYSDNAIDVESFKRFMLHCAANAFNFNAIIADTMSCDEVFDAIARAGMARRTRHSGKFGVEFFAEGQPIEAVVNMANIEVGSFNVSYYTGQLADEMQISYADANGGALPTVKTLRVRSPLSSGFNNIGSFTLEGVDNEAQAAKLGRFAMAQNVYQKKSISFTMDAEAVTFRSGSVIALSHDLTQWGYSGRLRSASTSGTVVTLTLDEPVPALNPAGGTALRRIGLRLLGEVTYRLFTIAPFSGEAATISLVEPWPAGVALPGAVPTEGAHECLWVYDFKATPGLRARVVKREFEDDIRTVKVECTPEPEAFWAYVNTGAYLPPANNSLLSRSLPVVTDISVTDELRRSGSNVVVVLKIRFKVTGNYDKAAVMFSPKFGAAYPTGEARNLEFEQVVGTGDKMVITVQPFDAVGRLGVSATEVYEVIGLARPPAPFDFFRVLAQPDGTRQYNFGYTSDAPLDWRGAEIRYSTNLAETDFAAMSMLQDDQTFYTNSPVETNTPVAGAYRFACRSIDTTGNVSAPLFFDLTLPQRRTGRSFAAFDEAVTLWPGTRTGLDYRNADAGVFLEAVDLTTWDSRTTWDAWPRWSANPGQLGVYVTPSRDLGFPISAQIDVSEFTAAGSSIIEVRSSLDNTTWGAWAPVSSAFNGRYLQLRVSLTPSATAPVVALYKLAYQVSADIKREYLNDIDISQLTGARRIGVGDVRAPMALAYSLIIEANVVIQDPRAGWDEPILVDKNAATGPRWQFRLGGVLTDPQLVDFLIGGYR